MLHLVGYILEYFEDFHKVTFLFTVNGYEITSLNTSCRHNTEFHSYISSNCRDDKCYPAGQENWPHIGVSSTELRGKNLITRKRKILSEINTESTLTYVWSVERYKVAVLVEFSRTPANM
jgi:hypothetical protein